MRSLTTRFANAPLAWAVAFVVLFVVLPLGAVLVETCFDDDGFTLRAWQDQLVDRFALGKLLISIGLGATACTVALVFGLGHAWVTERTDLPFAKVLGPLGIAPLIVPPILVAMGFADFMSAKGFWVCAALLGVSNAPFVAVMAARGLRAVDGRGYEAAWLARGVPAANRMLVRSILPEVAAGMLFAFVFVVSEHGVPEFLTVKGKQWHTYAEHVQAMWTRRALGVQKEAVASPIVAALPLVALIVAALVVALRFRARSELRSDFRPLPIRRLGGWRWPALGLVITYLTAGVIVPIVVMVRWAMGSTQKLEPPSLAILRRSVRDAWTQAGDDLGKTMLLGVIATALLLIAGLPLARMAARRHRWIEGLAVVPLAVPAVLLSIGFIRVYNGDIANGLYRSAAEWTGGRIRTDFYDSVAVVACEYAARFLPFVVLTIASARRRWSPSLHEAYRLSGRGAWAGFARLDLPLMLPALWSVACLAFILSLRELDCAVLLPAGNGTVVRRLSNIVHFGGENTGGALALMLLAAATFLPILTVVLTGRRLRPLS
ncbi:MAG: ABC transporter permease [Planctomycetota bacterium]